MPGAGLLVETVLAPDDGVTVALPHEADKIAGPVHNHGEQSCDVAAQNTHIEGLQIGDSRILTTERDFI